MADPVSAAASLVTLISFSAGCAKQLSKLIQTFRHAPEEILALSNEVNDLNVILAQVEATS